jgi:hypothetical protein
MGWLNTRRVPNGKAAASLASLAEDWLPVASQNEVHCTAGLAVRPHCALAFLVSVVGENEFGDLWATRREDVSGDAVSN